MYQNKQIQYIDNIKKKNNLD